MRRASGQNPARQRGAWGIVRQGDVDNGNDFTVTLGHQDPARRAGFGF